MARHLGISSVRGRFTDFSASVWIAPAPDEGTKSRVEAVVRASSIDTGNATRDQHLRSPDFLDAERHPEITYVSTGLTLAAQDHWTVHGELGMHGVVRPVDLDLAYLGTGADPWGGTRASFLATTELRREDFAMHYNQVVQAGIAAIGTALRIELDIQAVRGETVPQAQTCGVGTYVGGARMRGRPDAWASGCVGAWVRMTGSGSWAR